MRTRRRLGWAGLGAGVFLVVLAFLARPENPYSRIRELRPTEDYVTRYLFGVYGSGGGFGAAIEPGIGSRQVIVHDFNFTCRPGEVQSRLAAMAPLSPADNISRGATIASVTDPTVFTIMPDPAKRGGVTCQISVVESREPWYLRSWLTVKKRLGL